MRVFDKRNDGTQNAIETIIALTALGVAAGLLVPYWPAFWSWLASWAN